MSVFNRGGEHRTIGDLRRQDKEVIGSLCRLSERASSPSSHMEQEKRIRREIANSNERRRMQSINAGFQSLRTLLPHHEGEKLSKAAILQQTAEYIYQLEQEKTSLLSQNCHLKRLVNQHEGQHEPSTLKKRKIDTSMVLPVPTVSESSDEGIGSMSPEPVPIISGCQAIAPVETDPSREMIELRMQLDRERKMRMQLEEKVRAIESQLYPDRLREITQQVQLHYHHPEIPPGQAMLQETAAAVSHIQRRSPSPLSPPRESTPSPLPPLSPEQRLPSVLEAAIKAEPKVEVERLPQANSPAEEISPHPRVYSASTSRQNLETIVEAIRHLEGDQFISDGPSPQEAPLALTTNHRQPESNHIPPRLIKVEMNSFLQYQQQRPGVIVVKQNT